MMNKLSSIEWKKIWPYKTFKALAGLYIICLILFFLSAQNFSIGGFRPFANELLQFPDVWHNLTYVASLFFNLILAVLIVILITNEYQFRTLRQNIIDGQSRWDIVLSKIWVMLMLAFAATIAVTLIGLTMGLLNTPVITSGLIKEQSWFLAGFFVHAFGLMLFASLLAHLFRKTGLSILMFLLYLVIIEPIIRGLVRTQWINYLPSKSLYSIIPFPYSDLLQSGLGLPENNFPRLDFMAISLAYSLLFVLLNWTLVRKRDL